MEILLSIIIIVLIVVIIKRKKEDKIQKPSETVSMEPIETFEPIPEEKIPYIRKNLMTKNEWSFYKELKPIADELNLSILCKTRIADLIDIEKGLNRSEWQSAFNKINKKHIDFILCRPENLYPELLIELDDNTHDTEKGKERDLFVEKILTKTGYKLLRTRGSGELKQKIMNELNIKEENNI